MTFLEQLSPEHRDVIVHLPYRIGLWVSHSDTSGGDEAEEREKQVLSNILHGFAEDVFGSETVQHIMSATIRQKDQWPSWGENIDKVPQDCVLAVNMLRQYADEKDANAFKNHLMEIAEAVALAFRENEKLSVFSMFGMYVSYMLSARKKGRRTKSFNEFLRISAAERKALSAIAAAMEAA